MDATILYVTHAL